MKTHTQIMMLFLHYASVLIQKNKKEKNLKVVINDVVQNH